VEEAPYRGDLSPMKHIPETGGATVADEVCATAFASLCLLDERRIDPVRNDTETFSLGGIYI